MDQQHHTVSRAKDERLSRRSIGMNNVRNLHKSNATATFVIILCRHHHHSLCHAHLFPIVVIAIVSVPVLYVYVGCAIA
jgi:hypothetical protein